MLLTLLSTLQAAGGGSTLTVEPSAGRVSLSGNQPSLVFGRTLSPGTGHAALTGKQASIVRSVVLAPSAGHAVLSGKQASISLTRVLAPAVGHVVLDGKQPTLTLSRALSPGAGHVALSGNVPSIVRSTTLTPGAGHVVLTGKVAILTQTDNRIIMPGHGRISFSGHRPAVLYVRWPDPSEVRQGVAYGPTGSDFTGTASNGETVFAQRLIVSSTEQRAQVFSRPQAVVQPPVTPVAGNIASKGKNVFVRTPVPQQPIHTTDEQVYVMTNNHTRSN